MTKIQENVKPKKSKIKKRSYPSLNTTELIDTETGELIKVTTISKQISADVNFHKVWLADLFSIIGLIGNKKMIVLNYLLKNMRNEDNSISITYQKICKDTKVSYRIVSEAMRLFIDNNLLKKISNGTYQFNPDILIKGSGKKRERLLIEYNFQEEEA